MSGKTGDTPDKAGTDDKPAAPTELKASLNLGHAVAMAVGQTIGSGTEQLNRFL